MNDRAAPDQAAAAPGEPGVYLMYDTRGDTIYVGKAKNLRSRLRSYFSGDKDPKTQVLIRRVHRLETIVCRNEYEALLLENQLIKRHQPRYNINLKDGKTYPVIRVTNEPYPRVFRTRNVVRDGSTYFGPFTNVGSIDTYLELIEQLFPLRKCRGPVKSRDRPCLYFHIGRCSAPCAGRISQEDYRENVEQVKHLLSGSNETVVADLQGRMGHAAEQLDFERAARFRDMIRAVEDLSGEQQVIDDDPDVRDYVAYATEQELAGFVVFQMRGGKLLGSDMFRTEVFASEEEDLLQFLLQYYSEVRQPPSRLYLPIEVGSATLSTFFRREFDTEVTISLPETARDRSIMALAAENARHDLQRRIRERGNLPAVEELQSVLELGAPPMRIEGFDIAHVEGKHPVAAMVSFWAGAPDKNGYRRFHMKSLGGGIDDFEAMRETAARRYTRVVNEGLARPDLVVVDGGKGQVGAVHGMLQALGLEGVPVVGLAKRNEVVFLPDRSEPITLPPGSPPLQLLQQVRDEAHRFATEFRASLQSKDIATSTLESVPGIGPARSRALLRAFGSPAAIAEAPASHIAAETGIPEEIARAVQEALVETDLSEQRTHSPQPDSTEPEGDEREEEEREKERRT